MPQTRTQPAGPKAFRLYATVRDLYRQEIGERAFAIYEALTYYVDPKTLKGPISLKLLAQTVQCHPTTVSRYLHKLGQRGLITITPQWDAYECVRDVNVYALDALPLRASVAQRPREEVAPLPSRRRAPRRGTLVRLSCLARHRLKRKVASQSS
ncbi:MAG: hypothetical protein AB7N91_09185 [Candidatus Tectimicrobiota bacterium]